MSLAFDAMQPLAVAAPTISRTLMVAAAGVVVVVAILLVFVMVLRGAGSSRRKASGIDYDPQRGQIGQPRGSANDAQAGQWNQARQDDPYSAANQGGFGPNFDQGGYGQDAGLDQGYGQQQAAQGWGQPTPANNANAWGPPAGAGQQWNDQMAPVGGQMNNQNDWGAQQPARPSTPWDAPAGAGQQWNNGAAATGGTRPGAGAAPSAWDAPQAAPNWDAAAAQNQGAWGAQQPASPSQPAWSPQQPAAQNQPAWGGAPQAPSQPAWGGAPQAPSQPAWGAQQPDPMMQPTVQRGAPRGAGPRLIERKTDGTGREFDLHKERLTIGRHRESDVFLEDLAVSRLNTTISHDSSGRYILRDENSANGTYVNGQRVSEYILQEGDEVQVGQTTLIFHQ